MEAKTRQVLPNIPNADLPGIVINGIHNEKMTQDAYNDLTGLVCDLYTGPHSKPKECERKTVEKDIMPWIANCTIWNISTQLKTNNKLTI